MGGGSSKELKATRVVIVGGGYAGLALLKQLDTKVSVTLIEVGAFLARLVTQMIYHIKGICSKICDMSACRRRIVFFITLELPEPLYSPHSKTTFSSRMHE
jgi:FlaA1/EpsC-like NDP-sugar epimerase